jgi:uncharacterized protein YlxW (UPF0749 family)
MALLQEVLDRPLDPGYQSAAQARQASGLAPSTGSRTVLLVGAAVLLGFLMTVAAQSLRDPDPAAAGVRAELAERVRVGQDLVDGNVVRIETLQDELIALEGETLPGGGEARGERVRAAGVQAGASAVVGPGVVVTLDDPQVQDGDAEPADDRVLARDLQVLVNGLWANGAEAVSINDLRLTSTSSIRFAGEAIVVDFRGLTRPYTVAAIGPSEGLDQELGSGATGLYLEQLRDDYGIIADVEQREEITVPAATRLTIREAQVGTDGQRQEDDR